MAKLITIIFFLISPAILIADGQTCVEKTEKIAMFRVYVHDIVGGPNPTVHEVARANITSTSPTSFGHVLVANDLMTIGPDSSSQKLGRAQGLAVSTGMEELSFVINGVFLFTDGEYKGSSISIMGWKLMVEDNQEIPIVGGTGIFRMARGYTVSNLYSRDPTTNYYLFSFDMYVVYHEQESGFE